MLTVLALVGTTTTAEADGAGDPQPGSPAYLARDVANLAAAYGRITGPGGQLANPRYLPALIREATLLTTTQLLTQVATPTRPVLSAGQLVPGWNVGNPLRAGWNGTRGVSTRVSFLNRYGALLRGTVHAPRPGRRDPYTGAVLEGPFPGVVITPGSVQGSEGMYSWLAQDLAERGYVVLTYDVQGQGTSETLPHVNHGALPSCDPFAEPVDGNLLGCPGVPFQQLANFTTGTEDALDFFLSQANPYLDRLDRSPDPRSATPGRDGRIAIIGHSLGAAAVSQVQGTDERVAAVVALDKLQGPGEEGAEGQPADVVPEVPALAVQSEYGFTVSPALLSGGSTLLPAPGLPVPTRERATGYDDWLAAGKDAMLVVPRASTHLEYTDIPLVLPASRHGQALTSSYVQAFLDRYLKHAPSTEALLGTTLRYLEPVGGGEWRPVTLDRDANLSFYYCSAHSLRSGPLAQGPRQVDGDLTGVGCSE
ncbi:alpha/beta fold hydrolase [Nocardioides caeni]|uniref:Alpha/beta fold hydrolase n=1 Tax=Nocardioides caeni TaxID=574700 RepID=A0A4S8NMG8_9ACTN|nr:alpha/beta fold hydrolase [Nocardioides caeni]